MYLVKFICIPLFAEFGGHVDVPAIINFIDGGGNVIVAASSNIGRLTH